MADSITNVRNGTITISEGLPTGISDPSGNSVEIYPNPANTFLYFRNVTDPAKILIYDLQGRVMISGTFTGSPFDISELDNGMYMIRIETDDYEIIRKLIKQ
jgi:hypothetical protein